MAFDAALGDRPMWADFDAAWYLHAYAADLAGVDPTPAALEAYYYATGARLKHAPNRYFDERWYLATYPDVAQAVADGTFGAGFEHYGLVGHKTNAPHWLFSEPYYLAENADLTADTLKAGHYANGYDHYLKTGDGEFRTGHWLFNPAMHRMAALAAAGEPAAGGEYARFLAGDRRVASAARLSWYFDPIWYLETYPDVARQIADGVWSCALEHYLCNDQPTQFNPNADFSEEFYRSVHLDVAPLLADGRMRNGFDHFLRFGAVERRKPHPDIDLNDYFRAVSVQTDIAQGHFADAFAHFEAKGGRARKDAAEAPIAEADGKRLYAIACENLLPGLVRHPLDFTCAKPALSVIIVASNRFAFTMATLASLRANYAGAMQVILVDSGSRDEVARIESYVTGLEVVRFRHNVGFVDGCNAGLEKVAAEATLFLNNDVQLHPGAVQNAMLRLWATDTTGAVGGKIIRTHGRLQEAGSIVWRDGWVSGYLRDADPNVPEANFVRAVDYCSAVFLLCKTDLLRRLGGFDPDYSPAYFEEADLCLRMRRLGFATIYDPTVSLQHYEFSTTDHAVSSRLMERNHPTFRRKNAEQLRRQSFNQPSLVAAARAAVPGQRRILFIEDRLPFRYLGSGFTRSNDIIHAMDALGYHVTIYPIYKATETIAEIYKAFPDTVEVIYDRELQLFRRGVDRAHAQRRAPRPRAGRLCGASADEPGGAGHRSRRRVPHAGAQQDLPGRAHAQPEGHGRGRAGLRLRQPADHRGQPAGRGADPGLRLRRRGNPGPHAAGDGGPPRLRAAQRPAVLRVHHGLQLAQPGCAGLVQRLRAAVAGPHAAGGRGVRRRRPREQARRPEPAAPQPARGDAGHHRRPGCAVQSLPPADRADAFRRRHPLQGARGRGARLAGRRVRPAVPAGGVGTGQGDRQHQHRGPARLRRRHHGAVP
jgi:GT2 family glycosyltransferase